MASYRDADGMLHVVHCARTYECTECSVGIGPIAECSADCGGYYCQKCTLLIEESIGAQLASTS